MSETPHHNSIFSFFHPSSPHLNFPVFTLFAFLVPLTPCTNFASLYQNSKKRGREKELRKCLIVWLQIPQCHQVEPNIMTTLERPLLYALLPYAHTKPDGDGSAELQTEGEQLRVVLSESSACETDTSDERGWKTERCRSVGSMRQRGKKNKATKEIQRRRK